MASTTVETRIHDLVRAEKSGGMMEVLSSADGRVYELDSTAKALVDRLTIAKAKREVLSLTIEGDRVVAAKEASAEALESYSDAMDGAEATAPVSLTENEVPGVMDDALTADTTTPATPAQPAFIADGKGLGYLATNLTSMDRAKSLFDALPALRPKSQCFQRAHQWAQMMNNWGVKSMKVFMFFTMKFRREHRFRWWFHVAPYVFVNGQEIVIDPQFVDEVRDMQHWTDFFMMDPHFVRPLPRVKPVCKEVKTYQDYENAPNDGLCMLIKVPMYYYQPVDLEALGEKGTRVEYFRAWDIKNSTKAR